MLYYGQEGPFKYCGISSLLATFTVYYKEGEGDDIIGQESVVTALYTKHRDYVWVRYLSFYFNETNCAAKFKQQVDTKDSKMILI